MSKSSGKKRFRRAAVAVLAALILSALAAGGALAASGDLDPSFGSDSEAKALVALPDGDLVVAGYAYDNTAGAGDFALARYNPNGSLDDGFGDGGKVTTDFDGDEDEAYALAALPDGDLVAAGHAYDTSSSGSDFALAHYDIGNEPPVGTADSYNAVEDQTLEVQEPGVLANDADPEGEDLSAELVEGPFNGEVALNPDGSFEYTPSAGFSGNDSFTYKVSDGVDESAAVRVRIAVASAPVDTTPPDAPQISSPPSGSYDRDGYFAVRGTAEPGSIVRLYEGTTRVGTDEADPTTGSWTIALAEVSEGSHSYTARATDASNNASGDSGVVMVVVDASAPTVSSVTPSAKPRPPRNTNVTATFSEAMDEASVEGAGTVTLVKKRTTSPVAATVTYDPATKQITLDPAKPLVRGGIYTATVTTAAKDVAGNPLSANKTWTFTVGRK